MSTGCMIYFAAGGEIHARIYRHHDGYPEGISGVLADLDVFFAEVEAQCDGDTRFHDPTYLAAKFVVWQAGQRTAISTPLCFRGLGVCVRDDAAVSYRYYVDCVARDARPHVQVIS